jgi:Co/Zn/Cd efflux system component
MIFVHAINFILVLFLWIFIWTLFNKITTKLNITNNQMIIISIIGILMITYIMYVSKRFKL